MVFDFKNSWDMRRVAIGTVRIELVANIQSRDFVDIALMVMARMMQAYTVLVWALRMLVSVAHMLVHRMEMHIEMHGC